DDRRQRLVVSPCRTTSIGERCLPFLPEAALSKPPAISLTWALTLLTPLAALATSLESTLILGRRAMALPRPLLRPFFEAARAIPPAAPASAAPPATSGTFALPATLPTVFPALLALSPASPTTWRTASTFECFDDEPFDRDLAAADLGLAFDAFGFGDFAVDLVRFDDEAARFFGLAFV
ncbi:MAG TPA: hypothetical protein VGK41_08800, partial [Solirubrobacterales bacterium]